MWHDYPCSPAASQLYKWKTRTGSVITSTPKMTTQCISEPAGKNNEENRKRGYHIYRQLWKMTEVLSQLSFNSTEIHAASYDHDIESGSDSSNPGHQNILSGSDSKVHSDLKSYQYKLPHSISSRLVPDYVSPFPMNIHAIPKETWQDSCQCWITITRPAYGQNLG